MRFRRIRGGVWIFIDWHTLSLSKIQNLCTYLCTYIWFLRLLMKVSPYYQAKNQVLQFSAEVYNCFMTSTEKFWKSALWRHLNTVLSTGYREVWLKSKHWVIKHCHVCIFFFFLSVDVICTLSKTITKHQMNSVFSSIQLANRNCLFARSAEWMPSN